MSRGKRRVPPRPDVVVAARTEEMWNRFVYADRPQRIPAVNPVAGGAPTVVVAASDATDLSKSKADIQCTGDDDQLQLAQALAVLEPAGGRLLLTEGNYYIKTPVVIPNYNLLIEGLGIGSTVLWPGLAGMSSLMILGDGTDGEKFQQIRDISFVGTDTGVDADVGISTIQAAGNNVEIERCSFAAFAFDGVNLQARPAGSHTFHRCIFFNCDDAGIHVRESGTAVFDSQFISCGEGVSLQAESFTHFMGNKFIDCETAIAGGNALTGGQTDVIVANNVFQSNTTAIAQQDGDNWLIVGNQFTGHTTVFALGAGGFGVAQDIFIVANNINAYTTLESVASGSWSYYCANLINGVPDCAGSGTTGTLSYTEDIGDGSNTTLTVTHSLNSEAVSVQLWDLTGANPVEATADATSIEIIDADNIDVTFGAAPGTDDYRIVVVKAA